MTPSSLQLRAAAPTFEEGRSFARYLDQAAEGFFRLMLGRRSVEIIANAYAEPGHDMSYQYVTFAEQDKRVMGMFSGYTAEKHRRSTDLPLRRAAGKLNLRMICVSILFSPMLRILNTIADGDFYLQAIAIDKQHRGKGVGSALLDAVEERASASGSRRLSLDVSAGNKGALALYRRRGMHIESQWPRRLPIPGLKLFRMIKSLDEN